MNLSAAAVLASDFEMMGYVCLLLVVLAGLVAMLVMLGVVLGRLSAFRRDLRELAHRLDLLASRLIGRPPAPTEPEAARRAPSEAPPAPAVSPEAEAPPEAAQAPAPPESERLAAIREAARRVAPVPPAVAQQAGPTELFPMLQKARTAAAREKFELFVGRKLLAWVGMVALLLASVLFIAWAYHQHWFSELGKVLMHAAAGLVLLGLGEVASRKKWIPLARTLSGGGIAELLFANFSALVLYHLIGWVGFFVFMGLVIAVAIALAVWYDSLTIAIIATLAGVATPLMLWTTHPDYNLVFAFLAGVNVAVLSLAWLRRWRVVNLIALAGSVVNILVWLTREHDFKLFTADNPAGAPLGLTIAVIAGFFAIFLAVSLVYHLVRREERPLDVPVFLLNPLWAYATAYFLFNPHYHAWMAPVAAGLGVLYLALAALLRRRLAAAGKLYSLAIAFGVGFLALAVPIQYDGMVIPMILAMLAAVLYAAAERLQEFRLRLAGTIIYALMIIALLFAAQEIFESTPRLILNSRFATLATCIVSLAVGALAIRRTRLKGALLAGPHMAAVPALVANGLLLLAFTLEVRDAYARGHVNFWAMRPQLICSLGYVVHAALLLLLGFALKRTSHLVTALGIVLLALIKILVADASYVYAVHARTIVNLRFVVLAACIVFLALAAVVARRKPTSQPLVASLRASAIYVLLAHALTLLLFTLEAATFFSQYRDVAAGHLARQMVYSIGYALYAVTLLATGFVRRRLYLRVAGLVLFGATLLKIAIYDLAELRDLYRIFSVFGLAVLLLAAAYLYSKYQRLLLPSDDEPTNEGPQTP